MTGPMRERDLLAALGEAKAARQAVALVTAIAGEGTFSAQIGRHLAVWPDPDRGMLGDLELGDLAVPVLADVYAALASHTTRQADYTSPAGNLSLFFDVQAPLPRLIVVGAGHIAVPLAAIARICDFAVTVLDDRPLYANRQRFPTADHVIAGPFAAELRRLRQGAAAFDTGTYLVLVTRGHQYDVECLLDVLDDPVAYIGMIGSQRRIRAVYELLEREYGVPAEKLDRIHAPIGIDIAAQTPSEIAVCIMAEMIKVAHGGSAASLSDALRNRRQNSRRQGTKS